jgi:hypothetical protein
MISIESIRNDIFAYLETELAITVYRGSVPELATLQFDNGILKPYAVLNFGDILKTSNGSFAGVRTDGYMQTINIYCVAKEVDVAEGWQIRVIDALLGYAPQYGSPTFKRPGSGTYLLVNNSGGVEAFIAQSAFGCNIQLLDLP